jgi:hypothetical protein
MRCLQNCKSLLSIRSSFMPFPKSGGSLGKDSPGKIRVPWSWDDPEKLLWLLRLFNGAELLSAMTEVIRNLMYPLTPPCSGRVIPVRNE